ncbi:MAG: site-2 protease family protein [Clostridiales Family XIII bacterium]|nr:site-2 protease family protein [Clostridiales Family XIII bacterium]
MFIVYAILIFAFLIFVHELGHLLTAKGTGIKVKEFAVGMGPRLWSVTRGETRYSVRPIPIGGFCAMEGEDEESDDPRAFNNRPAPARALVLVAGSGMNILLAVLMLSLLIFAQGEPTVRVDTVMEGSPAALSGLKVGDEVLAVNGEPVSTWAEISDKLSAVSDAAAGGETGSGGAADTAMGAESAGSGGAADPAKGPSVSLLVRHADGSEQEIETGMYAEPDGSYRVGITPIMHRGAGYFFRSFALGGEGTWNMTKMMYSAIGDLFTGKAGIDQLTGPVGIVKAVGDTAKVGGNYVIELAALISLNLGIVNLLPLPALDGGRILFLIIRLFTGKRVSDALEARIHTVGILALFALMGYITLIDVNRFIIN